MLHRLLTLFLTLFPFFSVWAAEAPALTVKEDLQISTKITLARIDVGTMRKRIHYFPEKEQVEIVSEIDVEVSALVISVRRKTTVRALYDKDGLVRFTTTINRNDDLTNLSGERVRKWYGEDVIHIFGVKEGKLFEREIPMKSFHFTSSENYPAIASFSQKELSWTVLDLFSGELDFAKVQLEKLGSCPEPANGLCYQLDVKRKANSGTFYYDTDGIMVAGDGEDVDGSFRLRWKLPEKEKKKSGGFWNSIFGGDDEPDEPASTGSDPQTPEVGSEPRPENPVPSCPGGAE